MNQSAILTKIHPKSLTLLGIIFMVEIGIWGQPLPEQTFNSNIKTVQLYRTGWEMSEPVILLGSNEQLTLSFDDLSTEVASYHYSIVHLSSNNTPSPIDPSEYVKGFPHIPIDDYQFSFNTTRNYVHYQATFPNDELAILKSGNYALKVYRDYESDKPAFIKFFKVTEQAVSIDAELRFSTKGQFRDTHQQLNFKINHPDLTIRNPHQEVTVVVRQNGRTDNQVSNLKPDFIRPTELVYEYKDELLFPGGNEFRRLDIRSTKFISQQVKKIFFANPYYQVLLNNDFLRWEQPYFRNDDSNGQYVVSVREYDQPGTNADYLYANFSLPVEAPFLNSDIYIIGQLSNWTFNKENKMHYNFETRCYEHTMLLKQGFYNYQYALFDKNKQQADLSLTEGNHAMTENDYHVFVYYKGPSDYCERLVGYTVLSSKNGIR